MQCGEPNLLIADDDRDFRESLNEVFSRRGFRTQLAADGREAVKIVESSDDLHLVLLDVHMPQMTGLEALERIRQLLDDRTLPCVLMSARFDPYIMQQAEVLQTASMLSKPFTIGDLTGTVVSVLNRSYGWHL